MQQDNKYKVICFGETLWDILPPEKLPGGAPMNVAYHLHKLGKKTAIISRTGNDDLAKELLKVLETKNIDTSFFQTDFDNPTGKVLAEIRENNEVVYDIIKPVAWDFIHWENNFSFLLENAEYFVFGSLITRNEESKKTLFRCLEIPNIKVLDINLRPPYFNKKIIQELLQHADILKLNLSELHLITGWFCDYTSDEDRINHLKDRFLIDTIIVTKGSDGAILNKEGIYYYHPGYTVTVADTIGSGDSFLAAIISMFIDNAKPEKALDFASALGAFIASCPGGCPEYDISQVSELMQRQKTKYV